VLEIDYTRTMMGFLLLNPSPRTIAMVGLGGGSLVKFCRSHLRSVRMTVVENNPAVIALRKDFGIPDDDERLCVIADDGADFVRNSVLGVDVLLVDGFDHTRASLRSCAPRLFMTTACVRWRRTACWW
jgi:spermidine synthase